MTDTSDLTQTTVADFVAQTAAKTPTPGGGSVAGVAGALGTALGEMALVFTQGKKAYAEYEADYKVIATQLANARAMFASLVAEDMAAYRLYQEASRHEGPDKDERMQLALAAAINVPRETAKLALAVLADLDSLVGRCNKWIVTDLAAGALLAETVVRLCDYNVRINVPNCDDKAAAAEIARASDADCRKAKDIAGRIDAWTKSQLTIER